MGKKVSGYAIGPRFELLEEANGICEERLLIYHTENFLVQAIGRLGLSNANKDQIKIDIENANNSREQYESAVHLISQEIEDSTDKINIGKISIKLKRPVKNFTVSGRLNPKFKSSPYRIKINRLSSRNSYS